MSFWSVIFSYSTQQAIFQSDCDVQWKVDFRQQLAMTSSMVRPWRSPKALSKAKLAPKRRSGSLFGGLLPIWSTTAFWIPVKPFHLRRMFSKSMRSMENCSACSWHWSTERAQFFSMTKPDHTSHNQWFKSWKSGLWHFASSKYSPDLSPNDYHFFKHLDNFLQGKRFHNQQDAENALQEFIKSQSMDFYATGVNKLISHWQKRADCNGSYFD